MLRIIRLPAAALLAGLLPCLSALAGEAPKPSPTPVPHHSFKDDVEAFGANILHPSDPYAVVPGKDPNGWSLTVEPYLWTMGMTGDVAIKGLPATYMSLKPKNILQNLDWAVMGKAELRKGRWGLMGDGFFAQLSTGIGVTGHLYDSGNIQFQQGMASLALAFRVIDDRRGFLDLYAGARYNYMGIQINASTDSSGIQDLSDNATDRITSGITRRVDDLIAQNNTAALSALVANAQQTIGSRVLEHDAHFPGELRDVLKVSELRRVLTQAGNPGRELIAAIVAQRVAAAKGTVTSDINNRVTQAQKKFAKALANKIENALPTAGSGEQWWVDPIIGLRGQINFTHWLFLAAQADVGGFGAGSQIAWNVQASLGVNFTRNLFGEVGYRYFYMDYSHGGALYNAAEAGLFLGIGVKL